MAMFKRPKIDWMEGIESNLITKQRGNSSRLTIARWLGKRIDYSTETTDQLTGSKTFVAYKVIPFQNLDSAQYVLNKPIFILLEGSNDAMTATCYDAGGLFGYGDTEQEAIKDLCDVLIQCFEDLISEDEENLGAEARRLKDYLTKVIDKKNAA